MRAIIIAAGRAKRMKDLSNDIPKCLLKVNGGTVLSRQIETLRGCGLDDITVVRGYKSQLVNYMGVRYRENADYMNNNILLSLFCAENDIKADTFIIYGDILFKPQVIKKLIATGGDIVVVADAGWKERYKDRHAHPITEAENVVMDPYKRLLEIGKILKDKWAANGEFIGMMKVSGRGAEILKENFNRVKSLYSGRPFQNAPVFEQAYLTDMLQELIDCGYHITCACIDGGWIEIDTPEDYDAAHKVFSHTL